MEDLVLSIEQCKHLQEFGLDMSGSSFLYHIYPISFHSDGSLFESQISIHSRKECERLDIINGSIPTLTFQEILDIIPKKINYTYFCMEYYSKRMGYALIDDYKIWGYKEEFPICLDGAYNMLVWLLKTGYLRTK